MSTAPRMFLTITVALLLWNLVGLAAYISQGTMDLAELARTDPYQAKLFAEMPQWAWLAYAVAVLGGLGGAIGLFLRKRWALPLFALSLGGIVVQFGRIFLMTDIIAMKGWATTLFPLLILAIGIFQLWYAMRQSQAGVLS